MAEEHLGMCPACVFTLNWYVSWIINKFYNSVQGKLEMEMELASGEEIAKRPVGRARDDPNQHPFLEAPQLVPTFRVKFYSIKYFIPMRLTPK